MAEKSIFGPVRERNVVFLIETSGSMYFCLRSVQDFLIEALLIHSEKENAHFNVIEFNRNVTAWADRCVSCNPETVGVAARWIRTREVSPGNSLVDAIHMAFEDETCDAIYVISNSLSGSSKHELIEGSLYAAKGRPVHCIYLASALSDPAAEALLYDLAWQTRSSFRVIEVTEKGKFHRSSLVFDSDQCQSRSHNKNICPQEKFCSVTTGLIRSVPSTDTGLPWHNRHDPFWWSGESRRSQAIRAVQNEGDAMASHSKLPGPGALLIDKKVLARRIEDGYYYLGRVKSEVARDRFRVQFDELHKGKYRDTTFQEIWVYDIISFVDAFRHPVIPGDKVLVPMEHSKYAPAVVLQGHEQRSDPTPGLDRPLIVNHLDGRSETLNPGIAIWIPHKLYERISFELRLPASARKVLESHLDYPKASMLHEKAEEVVEVLNNSDVEYEEIVEDVQPDLREYYRNLYPQLPWWWKMWWQRSHPHFSKDSTTSAHSYFSRMSNKDERNEVADEQHKYLTGRRETSPSRLSYSDDAATQTVERDFDVTSEHHFRSADVHRPPWRYWRDEEPHPQMVDAKRASHVRISSSPVRRREEAYDAMRKSTLHQRWFDTQKSSEFDDCRLERKDISREIEYRPIPVHEVRFAESTEVRHCKQKPEFVDYVNRDRGLAEWSEKTEPRLPSRSKSPNQPINHGDTSLFHKEQRHHHHHHHQHNHDIRYQPSDEISPAGIPALNVRPILVDRTRSRRGHYLQRLATEADRERQAAEKQERAIDARASYNASVKAWFAEKEERNFEREQAKVANLQKKHVNVETRHQHEAESNDLQQHDIIDRKRAEKEARAVATAERFLQHEAKEEAHIAHLREAKVERTEHMHGSKPPALVSSTVTEHKHEVLVSKN